MRVCLFGRAGVVSIVAAAFLSGCASGAGPGSAPSSPPSTASAGTDVGATASARPRPYSIFETRRFERAVERGTRTRTGRPGPNYWQQYAIYRLEAEFDPATNRLTGRGTLRYHNRSPDTLRNVFLHLYPNLFAPGAVRNEAVPVTGGVELKRVAIGGRALAPLPNDAGTGFEVEFTILRVQPASPLLPGASVELEMEWSYVVPPDGAPRGGRDGEIAYIAYWYPQFAVYDDVERLWQTDPYMGTAEFYMGYADYDVALTVPEGWLVTATGVLTNRAEVLTPRTRARLDSARRSHAITHVVREEDRGAGRATARGRNGKLTWRFEARNVRDFAFGTSDDYLWDATIALVGDATGDGRADTSDIHTFWRPERRAWAWDQSARYAQHSVEFLSRYLWPYPYPHMTAVDGVVSCSGMEYPMMTCIGGRRDTLALYSVTVHEIAHMWFPMQVGSDEKRYSWQDEGLTRFNQAQGMQEFFPGYDRERLSRDNYLSVARADREVELMRHGDLYPLGSPAFAIASYDKMAINLRSLRALLGDELFLRAYREYGRRWINKHPTPFDFWNTFEDVAGRDLDWFWRTWWLETWTLDQAIGSVRADADALVITVEDRGLAPMPVRLAITRTDGGVERMELPVDPWLAGARTQSARIAGAATVRSVEIDPELAFPDVDRSNNRWNR